MDNFATHRKMDKMYKLFSIPYANRHIQSILGLRYTNYLNHTKLGRRIRYIGYPYTINEKLKSGSNRYYAPGALD